MLTVWHFVFIHTYTPVSLFVAENSIQKYLASKLWTSVNCFIGKYYFFFMSIYLKVMLFLVFWRIFLRVQKCLTFAVASVTELFHQYCCKLDNNLCLALPTRYRTNRKLFQMRFDFNIHIPMHIKQSFYCLFEKTAPIVLGGGFKMVSKQRTEAARVFSWETHFRNFFGGLYIII